jgi:hypothetical protein
MANYTPFQVYERVPFREKAPDRVIFTGKFSPTIGSDADIPIQLRILEPVAAAGTWSGFTGAGYPGFEEAGSVKFSLPVWSESICGTPIKYQVRGAMLFGAYTDWETFDAVVSPRSDDRALVRRDEPVQSFHLECAARVGSAVERLDRRGMGVAKLGGGERDVRWSRRHQDPATQPVLNTNWPFHSAALRRARFRRRCRSSSK